MSNIAALIDAGALVTGMSNQKVAEFLLSVPNGLEGKDGVVFIDEDDQQMIMVRSNKAVIPVQDCTVSMSRRFTFYDQVHTTGMDIAQTPNAIAVLTIGKDMMYRDYAQAAYRMRRLGAGQQLRIIFPESILALIKEYFPNADVDSSQIEKIVKFLIINSVNDLKAQESQLQVNQIVSVLREKVFTELIDHRDYGAIGKLFITRISHDVTVEPNRKDNSILTFVNQFQAFVKQEAKTKN